MIKYANSLTSSLSQYTNDPAKFITELCKVTDVINDCDTEATTANAPATCKQLRKRSRGKI